jgi:hypothetical protein
MNIIIAPGYLDQDIAIPIEVRRVFSLSPLANTGTQFPLGQHPYIIKTLSAS